MHRRKRQAMGGVTEEAVNPAAIALRTQLVELAKRDTGKGAGRWEDLGGSCAILPADAIPWGVAHFVGGAVLGQFPQLCYDALLRPLADQAGVAVVCTPYELGSDHDALALDVGTAFEMAVAVGAARYGWSLERMPRFALGHSLGAKLQVLLRCRAAAGAAPPLGIGLLAFNNFGVQDQVRLLRETLQSIRGTPTDSSFWESVIEPSIGRVAQLSGMEFQPGPEEMLARIRSGYAGADRTRLFRFADDGLDCSGELLDALAPLARLDLLGGGHLTPVLISLADVGQQAGGMPGPAGKVAGRVQERLGATGISLGNQEQLEALVDSLVAWVRAAR